jgi:hypothetical protein
MERIRIADWNDLPDGDIGGWITPGGRLHPIGTRLHIKDVCRNPEFYGLTLDRLLAVYDRHEEAYRPEPGLVFIGGEGRARNQIMIELIEKGWVRYRRRISRWTSDAWMLSTKMKETIFNWARSQITGGYGQERVTIQLLKTDRLMTYRMIDLANYAHIDEPLDVEDGAE